MQKEKVPVWSISLGEQISAHWCRVSVSGGSSLDYTCTTMHSPRGIKGGKDTSKTVIWSLAPFYEKLSSLAVVVKSPLGAATAKKVPPPAKFLEVTTTITEIYTE